MPATDAELSLHAGQRKAAALARLRAWAGLEPAELPGVENSRPEWRAAVLDALAEINGVSAAGNRATAASDRDWWKAVLNHLDDAAELSADPANASIAGHFSERRGRVLLRLSQITGEAAPDAALAHDDTAFSAAALTLLSAAGSIIVTPEGSSLLVSFLDYSSREDGFLLETGPDGETWTEQIILPPQTAPAPSLVQHTLTDRALNTLHWLRVRAFMGVVGAGDEVYSSPLGPVSFWTPPPAPPSGIVLEVVDHQRIDVSWTLPAVEPAAGGYRIYRAEGDGEAQVAGQVAAGVATFSDTGLLPETGYRYHVTAFNFNDPLTDAESAASEEAEASTPAAPLYYRDIILADGPAAYWRLNETAGTVVIDDLAGHNGVYSGSVSLGETALVNDPGGKSARFTGGSADLGFWSPGAGAFSFELWATVGTVANVFLFSTRTGGSTNGFELLVQNTTGRVDMRFDDGTTRIITGANGSTSDPQHFVCVFEGALSNARYYRNGALVGSAAYSAAITHAQRLCLARRGTTFAANNKIDEVAVYNKALTAAQVLAHYNKGISG